MQIALISDLCSWIQGASKTDSVLFVFPAWMLSVSISLHKFGPSCCSLTGLSYTLQVVFETKMETKWKMIINYALHKCQMGSASFVQNVNQNCIRETPWDF